MTCLLKPSPPLHQPPDRPGGRELTQKGGIGGFRLWEHVMIGFLLVRERDLGNFQYTVLPFPSPLSPLVRCRPQFSFAFSFVTPVPCAHEIRQRVRFPWEAHLVIGTTAPGHQIEDMISLYLLFGTRLFAPVGFGATR